VRALAVAVLALGALVCLLAPTAGRAQSAGTEFVLVLDNSGSMIAPVRTPSGTIPPADPLRQSVLGALVVEALTRGTDDALTVVAFERAAPDHVRIIEEYEGVRNLSESGGTWFLGPLERARSILEGSPRTDRILVFLSDGAPNDYTDPRLGREALGLDRPVVPFDTVIIGLLPGEGYGERAERFLKPLAVHPDDWVRVEDGDDLVKRFTEAYARALGSKALVGLLSEGAARTFRAGRYVTEVMVITASTEPTGPFEASLTGPGGVVPVKASGDNGCTLTYRNAPGLCDPPRMHYRVWRTPHDPLTPSTYTLSVDRTRADVVYGVVLRYDLSARVEAAGAVRVEESVPIEAHLTWKGRVFDDERFFAEDGFEALALVDGSQVALDHVGEGRFVGRWTPARPSSGTPSTITAVFRNAWMEERATTSILVEGYLPLVLRPDPPVLDFGSWRGQRRQTARCAGLDLSGSTNAERIPLDVAFTAIPGEAVVTFTPLDMEPGGRRQPVRWEACVEVPGCCSDVGSADETAIVLRGSHPHYHPDAVTVPVRFQVRRTGFFRCWWPWLVVVGVVLFVGWVLLGFIRPHDFDEDATVRIAGSERQLARAASLVLREQPRGRRGFYRNARVCITSAGDFVASPKRSAVWVEAIGGGETVLHPRSLVERKDRRTRKWEPVDEEQASDGVRTDVIYRVGETLLRFG